MRISKLLFRDAAACNSIYIICILVLGFLTALVETTSKNYVLISVSLVVLHYALSAAAMILKIGYVCMYTWSVYRQDMF